MSSLSAALLLAVGGSALPDGSWAYALRIGAVLVVAVVVTVLLVGALARALEAAPGQRPHGRDGRSMESDDR